VSQVWTSGIFACSIAQKIFTCSLPVSVDWSRDVEIVSHACYEPSTQPDVSDTVKHVLYIY
jgi:hypothetical protein